MRPSAIFDVARTWLTHSLALCAQCFIGCHLNAFQENTARRIQDYQELAREFSTVPYSLFSHDCVFWTGDLNSRIDLPDLDLRRLIETKQWASLLLHDQLKAQQRTGGLNYAKAVGGGSFRARRWSGGGGGGKT